MRQRVLPQGVAVLMAIFGACGTAVAAEAETGVLIQMAQAAVTKLEIQILQ